MKLALPEGQQLRDAAITATQARRWLASAPVIEAIVASRRSGQWSKDD